MARTRQPKAPFCVARALLIRSMYMVVPHLGSVPGLSSLRGQTVPRFGFVQWPPPDSSAYLTSNMRLFARKASPAFS